MEHPITQPNARTYALDDLVREFLAGRVRIPPFQRQLRWQWEDVRRLFDSIEKGYPIGSLLLWEHPANAERVRLGAIEIDAPAYGEALWVVDGQQRLTSLANALSPEGSKDQRFALAYDLRNKAFQRPSDDDAFVVPLPVLFDLQSVLRWFRTHPDAADFLDEASRITKAIRQYSIPAYIVKQDDEAVLRDIFDRMNNYGKRLTRAEVFSALHSRYGAGVPPQTFSDIAELIDADTGFGRIDDDTVLRAVLARRSPDVTREIRVEFDTARVQRNFAGEAREDAYRGAEQAIHLAVAFLQDEAGIPHFTFLPYRFLLVVLTRFFAHHPDPSRRNRDLLRRWVWRAAMAGPQLAKGSATAAMRMFANRVSPGSETESVQALLDALDGSPAKFALPKRFKSNTAEARFILCALWALRPRSVSSGIEYGRSELADALLGRRTASDALEIVFPRENDSLTRAGNRFILLAGDTGEFARERVATRPLDFEPALWAELLRSHAMNLDLAEMVRTERAAEFFDARDSLVEKVSLQFLERMTERSFEDTPPLADLVLDEEGEERDDAAP